MTDNQQQSAAEQQRHHIGLPVEVWHDILLFFKRQHFPAYGTIPLVNRLFHKLTYPLMHEKNPHSILEMFVYGDDEAPEGFYVASHIAMKLYAY
jgi:hypothetical protein